MESNEEDDLSKSCQDIIFRKAKSFDVDDIIEIYDNSIEHLDKESREWIQSIIKRRSRRIRVYVVHYRAKVVGFSIVYKKRDKAYIDAFAIDAKFRGKGIGQCFLRYLEDILSKEGIKRVYLTVKNNNNKALGMYIKNNYRISNLVLIFEAPSENIDSNINELDEISIEINTIKRSSFLNVKLLDTAIWNNFTWDIDEAIYRIIDKGAIVLTIYRGEHIAGTAWISRDFNRVVVERLALSYYRPSESLKILINMIKIHIVSGSREIIVVPIDSSKFSLLKTLISMGFRINGGEYVLYKDLLENRNRNYEKDVMIAAR